MQIQLEMLKLPKRFCALVGPFLSLVRKVPPAAGQRSQQRLCAQSIELLVQLGGIPCLGSCSPWGPVGTKLVWVDRSSVGTAAAPRKRFYPSGALRKVPQQRHVEDEELMSEALVV